MIKFRAVATRLKVLSVAVEEFLQLPVTMFLLVITTLAAFGYSYNANATVARETMTRASLLEVQNQAIEQLALRNQFAFCGLVEGYAYDTGSPTNERGAKIQEQFINAQHQLGCTPDPTDGR